MVGEGGSVKKSSNLKVSKEAQALVKTCRELHQLVGNNAEEEEKEEDETTQLKKRLKEAELELVMLKKDKKTVMLKKDKKTTTMDPKRDPSQYLPYSSQEHDFINATDLKENPRKYQPARCSSDMHHACLNGQNRLGQKCSTYAHNEVVYGSGKKAYPLHTCTR